MGAGNQQERPVGAMRLRRELTPDYISGFVDGEGCFCVSIRRHPSAPHGWFMQPTFQVYQHECNAGILEGLREYFGCGHLSHKGPNSSVMTYSVYARRDLVGRIVPFFDEHPLVSMKQVDCERFREVLLRMVRKEHLDPAGFDEIVRIAFEMNAHGKQRKYHLDDVLIGILRDCTPGASRSDVKIQSEPHGDMGSWTEMIQPALVQR